LSPEQIKGYVSEKSDIWSLGIIMYMTLCNTYSAGKPPFFGKTFDETVEKILNDDINFKGEVWNNISTSVQNLIETLLDKDPDKRPTADKILMHPWFIDYSTITISKTSSSLQALKNLSEFRVKNI
jgi:serine/threonine protein kinase